MEVVDGALYIGSGVKSAPIARGENSGDGERGNIFAQAFSKMLD